MRHVFHSHIVVPDVRFKIVINLGRTVAALDFGPGLRSSGFPFAPRVASTKFTECALGPLMPFMQTS